MSVYYFYSILFYPITLEGRRGTTDEFATTPFHLDLFSATLVELAKSIPVHSLILSSHKYAKSINYDSVKFQINWLQNEKVTIHLSA